VIHSENNMVVYSSIISGPAVDVPLVKPIEETLRFPTAGNFTVSLRKLTTAAPFGMGAGGKILKPSVIVFYGISGMSNATLKEVVRPERRIEFIGASDTAGYCVDGTPNTSTTDAELKGWEYENCDSTSAANLGRAFGAEINVQGISGSGLTQNAEADQKWQLGPLTMPDLWSRTLQTENSRYNFSNFIPHLVVVSLGGNDFNHQGNQVPTNSSFTSAYEQFLLAVFHAYTSGQFSPVIVNICGQGSPQEAQFDPDNNRCRPCSHVSDATISFQAKHPEHATNVHYVFAPCNGSVVTGRGDIGCAGHKNARGQEEVSSFLAPKLRAIMQW
jgi:hypothetical protein